MVYREEPMGKTNLGLDRRSKAIYRTWGIHYMKAYVCVSVYTCLSYCVAVCAHVLNTKIKSNRVD